MSRLRALGQLSPLLVLYVLVCAVSQPGAPVHDEGPLLGYAHRLLDGGYADAGTSVAMDFLWHGPGLPLLLAPLVALDLPLVAVRFVEPVLLGAAVLAFHRLLRLRLPPRAALVGTYAFGLYVPFLAMLGELHKEPLAILLVVIALLGLSRGLAEDRRAPLIVAGLALGGLSLVRVEYAGVAAVVLIGAALALVLRRVRLIARGLVVATAVALLVFAPWLAYTHAVTGRLGYLGNAAGLSLYWMSPNSPGESGQWHRESTVFQDQALRDQRPLWRGLERLDPLRRDDELRRVAIDNIRAEPKRYLRNLAANTTRLFFLVPMRPARSPVVVGGCLAFNGFLLAGALWAAVRLRRTRRRRPRLPEAVPFALLAALFVAVHVPFSANPRLLMPVVPVLLWFVVHGASLVPLRWSSRTDNSLPPPGVGAAALAPARPASVNASASTTR